MLFFRWLVESLIFIVNAAYLVFFWAVFLRVIVSWVNADPYNEIVQVIVKITEPVLAPFRRLPLQLGMIDFTPWVALIALYLLRNLAVTILYRIAYAMG